MANKKRGYARWTLEEEAALRAGVTKYGEGKWKRILADGAFTGALGGRSNVDLKDKWRTLSCAQAALRPAVVKPGKLSAAASQQLRRQAVQAARSQVSAAGDDLMDGPGETSVYEEQSEAVGPAQTRRSQEARAVAKRSIPVSSGTTAAYRTRGKRPSFLAELDAYDEDDLYEEEQPRTKSSRAAQTARPVLRARRLIRPTRLPGSSPIEQPRRGAQRRGPGISARRRLQSAHAAQPGPLSYTDTDEAIEAAQALAAAAAEAAAIAWVGRQGSAPASMATHPCTLPSKKRFLRQLAGSSSDSDTTDLPPSPAPPATTAAAWHLLVLQGAVESDAAPSPLATAAAGTETPTKVMDGDLRSWGESPAAGAGAGAGAQGAGSPTQQPSMKQLMLLRWRDEAAAVWGPAWAAEHPDAQSAASNPPPQSKFEQAAIAAASAPPPHGSAASSATTIEAAPLLGAENPLRVLHQAVQ